jgi:initiation factor 1A
MVKNKGGGNHKHMARKSFGGGQKMQNKLRIAEDECEIYAQVEKMLGNGMCHVECMDNVKRLCIIRGKFRGRGKRDNTLVTGTWCLIGLRDYLSEPVEGKMEQCDLLEVYPESDKARLRAQVPSMDWNKFLSKDAANSFNTLSELDLEFTDDRQEDYKKLMAEQIGAKKLDLNLNTGNDSSSDYGGNVEINIDDI